jgi:PST family polysaccharide transporter
MTEPIPPAAVPVDPHDQFADPGHLRPHLRSKTLSGLRAVALRQGVRILVMVVNMVVISRILTPGDFGIYSLAYGVISLANAFKDMGLSSATISANAVRCTGSTSAWR